MSNEKGPMAVPKFSGERDAFQLWWTKFRSPLNLGTAIGPFSLLILFAFLVVVLLITIFLLLFLFVVLLTTIDLLLFF